MNDSSTATYRVQVKRLQAIDKGLERRFTYRIVDGGNVVLHQTDDYWPSPSTAAHAGRHALADIVNWSDVASKYDGDDWETVYEEARHG